MTNRNTNAAVIAAGKRDQDSGHADGLIAMRESRASHLIAAAPDLLAALREIEIICTESAADTRKRMGTRVGNALTVARGALNLVSNGKV